MHFPYSSRIMGPPVWSSGQSSWLQIQRSGLDFRRYQIVWEVVGLERGPLSLVSTTEELLGRKNSGSCLESRGYGHREPPRWPRDTLYPQRVGTNFADKRQSLGQYSLFRELKPRSFLVELWGLSLYEWTAETFEHVCDLICDKMNYYCVIVFLEMYQLTLAACHNPVRGLYRARYQDILGWSRYRHVLHTPIYV
jgi:hypothetical protein